MTTINTVRLERGSNGEKDPNDFRTEPEELRRMVSSAKPETESGRRYAATTLEHGGKTPATAAEAHPPPPEDLIATEDELRNARLTPTCIVRNLLYADVAQLVAPGGTGKTTVLLYETIYIALGRRLWGLDVESPGWTLVVTAEDQRERLLARLREILKCMDLTEDERATAIRGVRIWDVTGQAVKLVRAADGNVDPTNLADSIVEAYQGDPPAVVIFDPLVSFGASEGMVNDNEQGIITAARRIVRQLGCCVRLVHHTGKANAKEASLDQYSGRGGSALADGSRMTTVLQPWGSNDKSDLTPPSACVLTPGSSITVMARAKLSYAPPNLPLIWIRRTGFKFEYFMPAPPVSPEQKRAAQCDQIDRYLCSQLGQGQRHTKNTLEGRARELGMLQKDIRNAVEELLVTGRVVNETLPPELRHGGKQKYLQPTTHPVGAPDEVRQFGASHSQPTTSGPTTPSPYRDETPDGVVPSGSQPSVPRLRHDELTGCDGVDGVQETEDSDLAAEGGNPHPVSSDSEADREPSPPATTAVTGPDFADEEEF